jgi:cytochrome c5
MTTLIRCLLLLGAALSLPATAATGESVSRPDADLMRTWSRTCALCHVDGSGGAPRLGHPDEWRDRVAQGRDVLLENTVRGVNNMPPLGYCMACEADDFRALIDFMTGENP